ncbi:type II toxin-antitoxin system RelE/ParE family toxin [soil metagenome]
MAIRNFADSAAEDICNDLNTKRSRECLPPELHYRARIKLARLAAASNLADLKDLPGNRLEALRGERSGQFSIRINDQFRICFKWESNDAFDVEIVDYH